MFKYQALGKEGHTLNCSRSNKNVETRPDSTRLRLKAPTPGNGVCKGVVGK